MDRLDARLAARLQQLRAQGLARTLPPLRRIDAVRYTHNGRPVVGFCSNDYLALAAERALNAPTNAADPGASASRLIAGDWPALREAEAALARALGTADAVLYPSGYQANVSALSALLVRDEPVHSDALAHASLIDGIRLARARPTILPHACAPPSPETDPQASWWITESIFSMDGDRVPLPHLRAHLNGGGLVYLDEAHAFGLFARGQGLAAAHGILPTITVGTLGKAYGSAGAAVGGSEIVCHYLRTRSRGFVFSTGVSPLLAARITRVCEYLASPAGDRRRAALWDNAARLHAGLVALTGSPSTAPAPRSPIFPLVVGDNTVAVDLSGALLDRGFHVQAIRPPTVPAGTARLRITVSAAHERSQIDTFLGALEDVTRNTKAALRYAQNAADVS